MKTRQNADLRQTLVELGMSQADLARVAEVDTTTVSRWATGKRRIPGIVWAYLNLKREVRELADKAGVRK